MNLTVKNQRKISSVFSDWFTKSWDFPVVVWLVVLERVLSFSFECFPSLILDFDSFHYNKYNQFFCTEIQLESLFQAEARNISFWKYPNRSISIWTEWFSPFFFLLQDDISGFWQCFSSDGTTLSAGKRSPRWNLAGQEDDAGSHPLGWASLESESLTNAFICFPLCHWLLPWHWVCLLILQELAQMLLSWCLDFLLWSLEKRLHRGARVWLGMFMAVVWNFCLICYIWSSAASVIWCWQGRAFGYPSASEENWTQKISRPLLF